MDYSVEHLNNDLYKISITSSNAMEKKMLERPLSTIREIVNQHFDQAVKEELGEKATIESIVNDSGFPYEIQALVSIKDNTEL
jgi:hypothetical protein